MIIPLSWFAGPSSSLWIASLMLQLHVLHVTSSAPCPSPPCLCLRIRWPSGIPHCAFLRWPLRVNGCQGHSAHPVQCMGTGGGGATVILTFNLCFFTDISVSLLTLVVTACGLALFGVSLFVSWKLCWVPWRERGLFSGSKDNNQEPLNYTDTETNEQENSEGFLDPPSPCPDSSMKISHTSPDIPLSTQVGGQEHCAHGVRMKRQVTEPASSTRSVTPPFFLSARQGPPTHSPLLAAMALSRQEACDLPHVHSVSWMWIWEKSVLPMFQWGARALRSLCLVRNNSSYQG